MSVQQPRPSRHGRRWYGVAVIVLTAVLLLLAAGPASAAPPPTLGLDDLQTQLAANGTLDGYMLTTMSGSVPTQIPVKVLAVVDGFSWGKLIMFECTDPAVADNGGIAAGMSGSPIYVDVDGTDRMIGAVSYGDSFTLRGTGLATPIAYMMDLQSKYAAPQTSTATRSVRLDSPVVTATGVVKRIVLASPDAAPSTSSDTVTVHPLAEARISGLPSGSNAYQKVAAKLEAGGLTVVSGSGAGAPPATPDLAPGSPCGVVFSTGTYAISVLGTVTYVDGDTALLFGHPILGGYSGLDTGIGAMEGTLTGATVAGIWPSTYAPYKMMSPADAKGVVTQDRSAGVVARLSGAAATFPVTTHASVDGGADDDDETDLGRWFAQDYYPEISDAFGESAGVTSMVAASGLYHALDSDPLAGSATTTTTVVVNDGAQDVTITRHNLWDDNADETWTGLGDLASGDVTTILAALLSDPYDARTVTIESVDVTAAFSSARRYAGIADATTARAIHWGDNDVTVVYYRTGSPDPQTLHATLRVPVGTSLSGTLSVMSPSAWSDSYGFAYSSAAETPMTVADVKARIDGMPGNDQVIVAFTPSASFDESGFSGPEPAAETLATGDWAFDGGVEKDTAEVVLHAPRVVDTGAPIPVSGYVQSSGKDVPVDIYCQEAGSPEPAQPLVTVKATRRNGMAMFSALLPPSARNATITAEVGALSDGTLPGADEATVKVRAATRLQVARHAGRLQLTARVSPGSAAGTVAFERYAHGRWVDAGKVALVSGVARKTVSAVGVSKVRARYTGGDANAASAWAVKTVR